MIGPAALAAAAVLGQVALAGPDGISVMADDFGSAPRLVVPDAREPAWSPDGARLVFSRTRPADGLGVAAADGSHMHALTTSPGDRQPSWSPDGRSVVFVRGSLTATEIWTVGADGTDAHRLVAPQGSNDIAETPRFLADGSRLLFRRGGDVWSARPDGTGPRRLVMTSGVDVVPSPDGDVYVLGVPGGTPYTVEHSGSTLQRVAARGYEPVAFSGDGNSMVMVRRRGGSTAAELVDPVGVDAPRRIAAVPGLAPDGLGGPAWWSPEPASRSEGPVDGEAPAVFVATADGALAPVPPRGPRRVLRLSLTGLDLVVLDATGIRSVSAAIVRGRARPRWRAVPTAEDFRRLAPRRPGRYRLLLRTTDVLGHTTKRPRTVDVRLTP